MPAAVHHPKQNRILAQLRAGESARVLPALELVQLAPGQILCESGAAITEVYFPTTALVSLQSITEEDAYAQLAMTGNDGMVGVSLALGDDLSPYRAVAQNSGTAYRMHAELLRWELDQAGDLRRLVLRYTQALMMQMAQTAVCNRHHRVDQQLCRWLLQTLDRRPATAIYLTQTQIAQMLGVRREAVTAAAGKLQREGLITYVRGCITVLVRKGLEERACTCYAALHQIDASLQQALPDALKSRRARPKPTSVRALAELKLRQQPASNRLNAVTDVVPLVHELQVHQIELELSNEALTEALDEAEGARFRFADIYDFSPVAYITIDTTGVIRQINLAGAILLGIKRSELTRHRFSAFISAAQLALFEAFIQSVFKGQTRGSAEFDLVAGEHRPSSAVRIDAVPDEDGTECRMVVSDITENKQQSARERLLVAALEAVGNGVILTDVDAHILWVNPAFEQLTGYTRAEAMHRRPAELFRSGEQGPEFYQKLWRTILAGKVWRGELINATKSGESYHAELVIAPVMDEAGTIHHFVGVQHNISERKKFESQLQEMASTDPLTGLPNRRHFISRLEEELARTQRRENHCAALLMLDLDHFKQVNDSLGHAAGDAVLCGFASVLRHELRKVDSAGRIGGEEFAVLLPETDLAAAGVFAERMRVIVEQRVHALGNYAGQLMPVTVSIGVTTMETTDTSVDMSLARADEALYRAKNSGRNCVATSTLRTNATQSARA